MPLTNDPEINDRLRKRRTFADPSLESVPATPFSSLRPNTAALLKTRLLQDYSRLRDLQHMPQTISPIVGDPTVIHHNLNNLAVSSFVRDLMMKTEQLRMLPLENSLARLKSNETMNTTSQNSFTESKKESDGTMMFKDSKTAQKPREASEDTVRTKISFSIESIIGIK